jgi:hypothetical protein
MVSEKGAGYGVVNSSGGGTPCSCDYKKGGGENMGLVAAVMVANGDGYR